MLRAVESPGQAEEFQEYLDMLQIVSCRSDQVRKD